MKKTHKWLIAVVAVAGLAYAMPWSQWAEVALKKQLTARGITQLEFNIASIKPNEILFKDIVFGALALPELAVGYNPIDLISGQFETIHNDHLTFKKNNIEITLEDVNASTVTKKWSIGNITINGTPLTVSPLSGAGDFEFENNILDLSGEIKSDDKKTSVVFALHHPVSEIKAAKLKLSKAIIPWNEGTLSLQATTISLYCTAPISLQVNVKQVSLNALLSAATSSKATATGYVSGVLPVVITRDGAITLKQGSLKADKAGVLSLSPDVIPSDAPQVALLRELLKAFHYEIFAMSIESADDKKLSMLLSLQGNNPDVYNGRVVKLNVHLTGDVIELVTQSLQMLK